MLTWIGRIFIALAIIIAVFFHALVPTVKITEITNPYVYSLLSGADPLITAYVDAGWLPVSLLMASTLSLFVAIIGVLRGERFAARLIMLAAVSDAVSLHLANTLGYTRLDLGAFQVVVLGSAMVVLWLFTRNVTSED